MRMLVAPETRLEFEAAEHYYQQLLPGLGAAFGDTAERGQVHLQIDHLSPSRRARRRAR